MGNHPNRSRRRPVATCTDRAVILGHAETETEALALLNAWADKYGVGHIASAKIVDVMIDKPEPKQDRFPKAWVPA